MWKSREWELWFAWKSVPLWHQKQLIGCAISWVGSCDLLENLYLCGIKNNTNLFSLFPLLVVICLKICTFVASKTTTHRANSLNIELWFAWKSVPLWHQKQLRIIIRIIIRSCDLLENLYLCGIKNNSGENGTYTEGVVICLKICTFVASKTTLIKKVKDFSALWFAWKSVPLWHQKQPTN